MPWETPFRPRTDNRVTQNFCDGVVTVYAVTDTARPGYQPKPGLTKKVSLRYEDQRLGIQRYYDAMQNQIQVERVLRVPRHGNINNQDVAITEDGRQYQIDLVQSTVDVYPPALDITLTKIEQEYEVPEDDMV